MNFHSTGKVRENTRIFHSLRYLVDLELMRTHGIPNVCECTNSHKMEIFCGNSFPDCGILKKLEVIKFHTMEIPWALSKNQLNLKTHTIPRYGKLVSVDFPMYGDIFSQFMKNRWGYPYLSHSWILRDL